MPVVVRDDQGIPIMFADVPNSGIAKTNTQQKSGNTSYDSRSGKFASKGAKPKEPTTPPNTDPNEYARMYAAVRDAARQLESIDEGSLIAFLGERAANPDQVDIAAFLSMVKQQKINDLVDLLDQKLKGGKTPVALVASQRTIATSIGALTPDEVVQVQNVLESRGNDSEEVTKLFASRDVALSDQEYDDEEKPITRVELAEVITTAMSNMPAPHVTVNVPESASKTLKVVRGENGLIQSVEEA